MLKLKIPKLDDYWYEEKLQSDPKTMSYNAGWNVNYYGYHYDTGCIDFPKSRWKEAYEKRQKEDMHFFYIYDSEIDSYVGYCHYKYNKDKNRCDIGMLIEDKYRGKGYGKQGLILLATNAFNNGIDKIYDSIEYSRKNTIKMFKSIGFKEVEEESYIRFNKEEKGALFCLDKETYLKNNEKRMNKKELEEVIKELGIPKEEFYVLSSGNLVLRGLFKDAGDLDICISEKGLELLKNKFDLKKKENNFYQVNEKVECIVDDLSKRKYDDLGDYNGQSLEEYYNFLINSKREKDKIRLEIVEKELKK